MREAMTRIAAVARAEVRIRFRRPAALIAWLLVAASVYLIIPGPGSSWALMRIGNARAVYNSAAIAVSTGVFCSMILSMAGFYLVANSLRRELLSRTGTLIASSPIGDREFLSGKFIGNAAYLASIAAVCMLSTMVMFFLRGEGDFEPLVFVTTYLWLAGPVVLFCAAAALAFESLPALSGRWGEVLYFFLWAFLTSVPAILMTSYPDSTLAPVFDITGLAYLIQDIRAQFHTEQFAIGGAEIDPSTPTIVFPGITWSAKSIGGRFGSLILPALFLTAASLWFHRFNPSRVRSAGQKDRQNIIGGINRLLKPVTRIAWSVAPRRSRTSYPAAILADVVTTIAMSPLTMIGLLTFAIIGATVDYPQLVNPVLPLTVLLMILISADISVRDAGAGMADLLFTVPELRERYVIWKFFSSWTLLLLAGVIPFLRIVLTAPMAGLSLFIGIFLLAAGSTALGILTRGPKAFVGFYFMLLYVSVNANEEPVLDFAGFNLCATPATQAMYFCIGIGLLLAALLRHRRLLASGRSL